MFTIQLPTWLGIIIAIIIGIMLLMVMFYLLLGNFLISMITKRYDIDLKEKSEDNIRARLEVLEKYKKFQEEEAKRGKNL